MSYITINPKPLYIIKNVMGTMKIFLMPLHPAEILIVKQWIHREGMKKWIKNYIKRVWATNLILSLQSVPSSSQREIGSSKVISHCFKPSLLIIHTSGATLDPQQVPKQPTKPSEIKESDLLPFKSSASNVWKWFRLANNLEYSKQKTSHAEYQRAYCFKCFSDGIDLQKGSVVFCDGTQGTTSMTYYVSTYHAGEEAPILQKKRPTLGSKAS